MIESYDEAKELRAKINKISNEGIDDVIALVIDKARALPFYPAEELKKEAREWVKMFKHEEESKC